jgi:hypothetical protein
VNLEQSPLRQLPSWLHGGWRGINQMMFLRRPRWDASTVSEGIGKLDIETVRVIKLGIMYETGGFFSDRLLSDMESGLLLVGIWRHNGRPRKAPAEIIDDLEPESQIATDDPTKVIVGLPYIPQMSVWFPKQEEGKVFLVQPDRFRVWVIDAHPDECYWHLPRMGILYGVAAASDAVVEIKQKRSLS